MDCTHIDLDTVMCVYICMCIYISMCICMCVCISDDFFPSRSASQEWFATSEDILLLILKDL